MSRALTERDFVEKLQRDGLSEIEVLQHEPIGIDDCALYPPFDDKLLVLMRRHQRSRTPSAPPASSAREPGAPAPGSLERADRPLARSARSVRTDHLGP